MRNVIRRQRSAKKCRGDGCPDIARLPPVGDATYNTMGDRKSGTAKEDGARIHTVLYGREDC